MASTSAYRASGDIRNDRILLIDDVYASGARAQSAAFALREAGAEVVALTVIGRRINPDYSLRAKDLYEAQKSSKFEWSIPRRRLSKH
jgi:adenine/guanine phosphoribosyltransferase-like PRPP-binding protein